MRLRDVFVVFLLVSSLVFVFGPMRNPPVSASLTVRTSFTDYSSNSRTIYKLGSAWADVRDATSGTIDTTYLQIYTRDTGSPGATRYQLRRAYGFFDTSSIPDTATITGVSMAFWVAAVERTPFNTYFQGANAGASLSTGDFNKAKFNYNFSIYSMTGSGFKNVSFSSNLSYCINLTGITSIVLRTGWDVNGSLPSSSTNAYGQNFTTIKLWVTYTIPAVPSAPMYFEARTQNSSWIQLNWTKGADYVSTTVIVANSTGYPTVETGDIIYNDTGTIYNHTGLTNNTHWFYTAWSWNEIDRVYNATSLRSHDTTMGIPILGVNLDLNNATGSYTQEYVAVPDSYGTTSDEDADYNELPADCQDGDWSTWDALLCDHSYYISYEKTEDIPTTWTVRDYGGIREFEITEAVQGLNETYYNFFVFVICESVDYGYYAVDAVPCAFGGGDYVFFDAFNIAEDQFYEECLNYSVLVPGYEGYYVNFTAESQLNLTFNLVNATETHYSIWNSPFWDIIFNATGNTTPLTHYEDIDNATGTHVHLLNSTGYYIWANYTSYLKSRETIVDATGTHESRWNSTTGTWMSWANYTGNAGPTFIGTNLSVMNPNPGNGTHSTNYLKKDAGGLTTALDVSYVNFTTPAAIMPGDYSISIGLTGISNGPVMQNISPVYADAWASQYGDPIPGNLAVGQMDSAGDACIVRSYLHFNTTSVPDEATITSGYVKLFIYQDYSDTDFNVTIQQVKPPMPHLPLVSGDYWKQGFAGYWGNTNTSGYGDGDQFNIVLKPVGLADVNKSGFTNWIMRSDQDINQSEFTGDEWIIFSSSTAELILNYTIPSSNWRHFVNLTWYSNSSGAWLPYAWSYVNSNGTEAVSAVNFSGNDSYWWNVSYNSNHTEQGDTSVFTFSTLNLTSGSVVVLGGGSGGSSLLSPVSLFMGGFGGVVLGAGGLILFVRFRRRDEE